MLLLENVILLNQFHIYFSWNLSIIIQDSYVSTFFFASVPKNVPRTSLDQGRLASLKQ